MFQTFGLMCKHTEPLQTKKMQKQQLHIKEPKVAQNSTSCNWWTDNTLRIVNPIAIGKWFKDSS